MPGHPFRSSSCNRDFVDSSFTDTRIAACDRVIAFQAEYRGHVKLNWSYNPSKDEKPDREEGSTFFWLEGLDVVVFADAGQAWLRGNGPNRLPAGRIPRFGSWLGDAGLGVDWGGVCGYTAQRGASQARASLSRRRQH